MNKNWLALVIVAVITLVIYVGYQFYISLSGENSGFGKSVNAIESDLGADVLDAIKKLDQEAPVRDEALDNK